MIAFIILAVICLLSWLKIASFGTLFVYSYGGLLVLILFLIYVCKIEFLNGGDVIHLIEEKNNRLNGFGILIFSENIPFAEFKNQCLKKLATEQQMQKLKKIVIKTPLFFYWKDAKNFNPENHIVYMKGDDGDYIKLYDYLSSVLGTDCNEDQSQPQGKGTYIDNFNSKGTCLIMKGHHAYGDALAHLSMLFNLGDSNKYEYVKMPKISFFYKIYFILIALVKGIVLVIKYNCMKSDRNIIHPGNLTNKKHVYFSEPLPLSQAKELSKKYKVTLNDFLLGLLSRATYNYVKRKKDIELKELLFVSTFSVRGFPPPGEKYSLSNDFVELSYTMKISGFQSHQEQLNYIHNLLAELKKSPDTFVLYYVFKTIFLFLPAFIYMPMLRKIGSKPSFFLSNFPCPTSPVEFMGRKIDRMLPVINIPYPIPVCNIINSYNQFLQFTLITDEVLPWFNPKEYIDEICHVMLKEFAKE